MNKLNLAAKVRSVHGRKVKKLRQEGDIPSNIFGKKIKSLSIQVNEKEFKEVYNQAGETGLIELKLEGETRPVLVHDIQVNPKTDDFLHVDFLQVDLKEKVEAEVPVELFGESPAEKMSIGTVVQYINEVTVEALPQDLPEKFEIDTSILAEVDQAVYVKDLKIDSSKITIKNDGEELVVKVEPPQKVVEEEPVASETDASAEGEATTEGGEAESAAESPKTEESK